MNTLLIGFAIFVSVAVGLVVVVYLRLVRNFAHCPRAARVALRREIERAEQRHAPRKDLRKQYVEATRQELAS